MKRLAILIASTFPAVAHAHPGHQHSGDAAHLSFSEGTALVILVSIAFAVTMYVVNRQRNPPE